jgi:hypothetical protein
MINNSYSSGSAMVGSTTYARRTWIDQGIELGFWPSRDHAMEFNQALIIYARSQDWCKSPNSYASKQINDLLAGSSPAADRLWGAWAAALPIGWEDLFDWEITPGVINPGFLTWVSTLLHDSKLTAAGNAAEVNKQLKFGAKLLWERYQREISREVEQISIHAQRGQAYLPSGVLLPRDQPSAEQTRTELNLLMRAAGRVQQAAIDEPIKLIEPVFEVEPVEVDDFVISDEGRSASDEIDVTVPVTPPKFELHDFWYQIDADQLEDSMTFVDASVYEDGAVQQSLEIDLSLNALYPPVTVQRPLTIELLPFVAAKAKHLAENWRRRKAPFNIQLAAKYLIWSARGNDEMKSEAREWLAANYNRFKDL